MTQITDSDRVAGLEEGLSDIRTACYHYTGEDQDDVVAAAYEKATALLTQNEVG